MSTDTDFDTMTILEETTQPGFSEPGDHEKMAHYVDAEKLTDAMVFGTPLEALCGKFWVPTRDAKLFPVCPECKEIWEGFKDE